MTHVEGVELGEFLVARKDDAARSWARRAGDFERDPHRCAQSMARDDMSNPWPEGDVDPERREVDRRGSSFLGVTRLDGGRNAVLADQDVGFLGSGIHRTLDSSHKPILGARAPASRSLVLNAPPDYPRPRPRRVSRSTILLFG